MYQEGYVLAIKVNDQAVVEREPGKVYLPFGTEYTVFVKNLTNKRAMASISIDGTDISEGLRFIVPANDSVSVSRFVRNGNLEQGNSLKFLQHTEGTAAHRGVKAEDGLVRVEIWPEYVPEFQFSYHSYLPTQNNPPTWGVGSVTCSADMLYSNSSCTRAMTAQSISAQTNTVNFVNTANVLDSNSATSVSAQGFTAPGSISNQEFTRGQYFMTETTSRVMVMQLLGETPAAVPVKTVTPARSTPMCSSCGRRNRATNKFCSECGTSLVIV